MAASKQASKHTHTLPQCNHASVGLAQACPNEATNHINILLTDTMNQIYVRIITTSSNSNYYSIRP